MSPYSDMSYLIPVTQSYSPMLFLCYINDLPISVKSQVRLFADDCQLYRNMHTFNDQIVLQKDVSV